LKDIQGISFPFRIGGKGGVVTTKSNLNDPTHLAESIRQILSTNLNERVMENFGSNISSAVFDPNDESTQTLIKYEIVDALNQNDKRVIVTTDDIEIYENDEKLFAVVNFKIKDTDQQSSTNIEIGG